MRVYPDSDLSGKHTPDPVLSAEFPKESRWQRMVEVDFRVMGWSVYHTWNAMRSTPGFPDLVAWHPGAGVLVFAELKTERGKLSAAQDTTLRELACCKGAYVFLWRPSDRDEIMAFLTACQQGAPAEAFARP